MYYGAKGHLIVCRDCGPGASTFGYTYGRTYGHTYGGLNYIPHVDYCRRRDNTPPPQKVRPQSLKI